MNSASVTFWRLWGWCLIWLFYGGSCGIHGGNLQESWQSRRDLKAIGSQFIINGVDAKEGRYPYFVSLRKPVLLIHVCGGALIAPDWVVTAAHCIVSENKDGLGDNPPVYIGAYEIDDENVEVMVPVETIVHPFYNGKVSDGYDIALLKLPQPSTKRHAALPDQGALPEDGQQIVAMGFGRTSRTSQRASVLQEASEMNFLPSDQCNGPSAWNGLIRTGMICAQDDLQDTCFGDSGGPAVLANYGDSNEHSTGNPEWDKVIGVTSFGRQECGKGDPAVFTLVSTFRNWIDGVMSSGGSDKGP